jgi:hypothetical protein
MHAVRNFDQFTPIAAKRIFPGRPRVLCDLWNSRSASCSPDGEIVERKQVTLVEQGIRIPDRKLAREITELVRDTASPLLFHHSSRVYYFGALAGKRRGLSFDPELLYAGAMFHDLGLTPKYSSAQERFEVDGANAARDFLRRHDIPQADVDIQAFYDGIKHKPDTTFGNVKADVLADKDPSFRRGNFCSVIRGSA